MAVMIPEVWPSSGDEHEKKLYDVLSRLPDTYTVWHNAKIEPYQTDFIVYSPKTGVVIIEAKDWGIKSQLVSNIQDTCTTEGKHFKTPQGQVQDYLTAFKNQKDLFSNGMIPHFCCVWYTKITWEQYKAQKEVREGFYLASEHSVFFQNELNELEHSDNPGALFQSMLTKRFTPNKFWKHTEAQYRKLQALLGSDTQLQAPRRDWVLGEHRMIQLSGIQQNIIKELDQKKQALLTGPAGSGKTLILTALVNKMFTVPSDQLREKPAHHILNRKRVLYLCFNLLLAGYIKRLCARQHLPLGPGGVEVKPVFELLEEIAGQQVKGSSDSEDYTLLTEMALQTVQQDLSWKGRWDTIIVDEGQDFSPEMVQIVASLLNEETSLYVAADPTQQMYGKNGTSTWKNIPGIGEYSIPHRYRSTREIMAFAEDWLVPEEFEENPLKLGFTEGGMPEVLHLSKEEAAKAVAKKMRAFCLSGVPENQMAVLYARTNDKTLPRTMCTALESQGLMSVWASENEDIRRRYDASIEAVPVASIHSMKGMDFIHVALLLPLSISEGRSHSMLSSIDHAVRKTSWNMARQNPATPSHWRSVIYVGMTRARQSLTVIWYDDKA